MAKKEKKSKAVLAGTLVKPGDYEKARGTIVPATELAKIRDGVAGQIEQAKHHTISCAEEENDAYTGLRAIAQIKKTIENRRKEITAPLNASLKSANALFKEVTAPLIEADGILRDKILAFQRVQQEKAAKEQERREKIQAAHEAKGHDVHQLAEVEPNVGVSTKTKRWTYDVENIAQVPRKYLVLDSSAITNAIRDGERDSPGLKIYQKEGLRV